MPCRIYGFLTPLIALVALAGCIPAFDEVEDMEPEEVGTAELPILDAHPAAPGELLGLVQVATSIGNCSGTVIAADTVLSAAHCFCSQDLIGANDCSSGALVTYRPNPALPGVPRVMLSGTAIIHPDYNPSWTEGQYEHDLAIIKVNGVAPPHVPAVVVPDAYLPAGTIVRLAGFGRTGADCSGPSGILNFDTDDIEGYEDGHDIMTFDDFVWCAGDSGGAILDSSGLLYGVISMETPWTQKAIATGSETEWIAEWIEEPPPPPPVSTHPTSDLLWHNVATGEWSEWLMANGNVGAVIPLYTEPLEWQVPGIGDFNGDGTSDLLWHNVNTGEWSEWLMANGNVAASIPLYTEPLEWQVPGVGDFNGDGTSDLLWHNVNTGEWAEWLMANGNVGAVIPLYTEPLELQVPGIGDFNGDGTSDLLWHNVNTGEWSEWLMANGNVGAVVPLYTEPLELQVPGIGDFNGQ